MVVFLFSFFFFNEKSNQIVADDIHLLASDNPCATSTAEDASECMNLSICQEFYHKTWQLIIKEAMESLEPEMPFQKFSTFVLASSHDKMFSVNCTG